MTNEPSNLRDPKDDVFADLIGQFGRWQLILCLSVSLVIFSSGWGQMSVLFLVPKVTFWCIQFDGNITKFALNDTCYNDCLEYAYDSSPMETSVISEWGLICDKLWLSSFTQTILQLGMLLGGMVSGFLSDRYGRKNILLVAIVCLIGFSFSIPFSPTYATFLALRFFLGVATGSAMVIAFVIVMEVVGPMYREIFGCLFHLPFIFGHLTIPAFAYFFRRWNEYALALAVPPLLYLSYFFWLSESPRWLVSVGRVDEATKIVTKAAETNKLPTTNIEETLTQLSKDILQNRRNEPKLNYLHLLKTPRLRRRTICSCLIWMADGLTYFGVNLYIGQTSSDPFVSAAAAGAVQIPSNLLAMWLLKHYDRKIVTAFFFCLGGLVILVLGCMPEIFWVNLTLGTIGVSCAALCSMALYIHCSELYPTVLRNMGVGISSVSMRIGSMAAPFFVNLAIFAPWLPTVIFGLVPIAAGFLCLLLPETKNTTLPNSIDDVEK